MKRFAWALIPILMLSAISASPGFAASSLGSECKNGFDEARPQIKTMSDPTKKQETEALAKGAYSDLKSGEYQNCLGKMKRIKALML